MISAAHRLPILPQVGSGQAAGQAEQEACGVKVARPGRIDDPGHRRRGDGVLLAIGQDDAAALAPGQRGDRDMAAHRLRRCREVVSLVQRADLRLVGEQDIDLALDQFAEGGPMPPDTERVGEAQRDTAPGAVRDRRGPAKSGLRLRRVEQIAFEIGDLGRTRSAPPRSRPARARRRRRDTCPSCAARRGSP